MTTPDEDEFGELIDPDIHRLDQVGKAANGTPWLIAKSAAPGEGPALFDPEFVREQVTKADGETVADPGMVTVTGRPDSIAAVMRRMHESAVATAEVQSLAKADLSAADINDLPDDAFAYIEPGGTKDADGKTTPRDKRHFPVHDEAHVRNALSRAPQSPFGGKAMPKIRAAAKHFGVQVTKADGYGDPGSPAWEAQDTDTAEGLIQAVLALRPRLEAFAAREGAEFAAGDMGDLGDVIDLQVARDCLMQAAKLIGGVAVAERAEAGVPLAKASTTPAAHAAPNPQESTVTDTDTTDGVRKAEETAPTATQPTTPAAADVAKGTEGGLTQAELAQLGREFLLKKAAKKAAKAAAQASGASAPDGTRVIPGTETVQAPAMATEDVMKAAATIAATAVAEAMAPVTKQLNELVTQAGSQSARVEKALAQPDDRRSPMLNGATGTPGLAPSHRGDGFERSTEFEPVRKALAALPDGPQKEEAQREVAIAAIKGRFS